MRQAPSKQRCHLGNFKAKGSGLYRLTVRHGVSYDAVRIGFRTEQVALCIWQRTVIESELTSHGL